MKIGLFVAAQYPQDASAAAGIDAHLAQVGLAREAGFSTVVAGQHFLSHPYQMAQPIPLLARLAAVAEGMRVGPAILLLTLLNPLEVAENLATLDAISPGGVVAGFGLGYRQVENAAFGVEDKRAALFEGKVDVVRRLLAGERVTASGPGYELSDAQLSLTPRRTPEIWIAANSDAAVRRAARIGDAWLLNPHTTIAELERQVGLYRAQRTECGMPESALPALREVCVAETDEAALEIARPYLGPKYDAYVEWGQSEALPPTDTLRRNFSDLAQEGRFVIGSPQSCAEQMLEHESRLGVDEILCRVAWPGMPPEQAMRSLELLAREVLPLISASKRQSETPGTGP